MSDAYEGKSDEQIIGEQAASLASKDNYQTKDSYNPKTTTSEEESNVNDSGLDEFPGAQVSIGRTGQTGGGTNAQIIPPEEGGLDKSQVQGESSDRFEGRGEGGVEERRNDMLANNAGSYDSNARGIDEKYNKDGNEVVPLTTGQELQPGQGLNYDEAQ
jgi:hypothetical protein